ncbi:hypothetical protein SFRURICE_015582 [Spodoptera frugiperda]|nr:hypothetical protein SFRURICE_015582 [Spodoptera frugiperda]
MVTNTIIRTYDGIFTIFIQFGGKSYIGQTKRTVACRISEHIRAVKNNDAQKSAIAQHILEAGSNHWMELHNPQVISTECHYIPRLVREAIEITKYKNFNREDGFQLSRAWNPVVQLCKTRKSAKKEKSSRADTRSNQWWKCEGSMSTAYDCIFGSYAEIVCLRMVQPCYCQQLALSRASWCTRLQGGGGRPPPYYWLLHVHTVGSRVVRNLN